MKIHDVAVYRLQARSGVTRRKIIAKSRGLKRVQEPFSTQGYVDLFTRAGFADTMSVIKWVCFEGFLGIK